MMGFHRLLGKSAPLLANAGASMGERKREQKIFVPESTPVFSEADIAAIRLKFNEYNAVASTGIYQAELNKRLLDPIIAQLRTLHQNHRHDIIDRVGVTPGKALSELFDKIQTQKQLLENENNLTHPLSTATIRSLKRGLHAVEAMIISMVNTSHPAYVRAVYNAKIVEAERQIRAYEAQQVLNCCAMVVLCGCAIPANFVCTALNLCSDVESDCTLSFCPSGGQSRLGRSDACHFFAAPCHSGFQLWVTNVIYENLIDSLAPTAQRMKL
jgi:hypothetical protein